MVCTLSFPTILLWLVASASFAAAEFPWVAIGDSFSAGPGAGDKYGDGGGDCFRNVGSYPAQLEANFPLPDGKMQFLSCTGAKTPGVIDKQIPEMDPNQKVMLLSIGGNDIGFGRILKACVFRPGGVFSDDCDETLARAHREINDGTLSTKLQNAYKAVTARLTGDHRRIVLVQTYPNFFVETSAWCNEASMGIWPGSKPMLTTELRRKLNILGSRVRETINKEVVNHHNSAPTNEAWRALDPLDLEIYPGHRFCEERHSKFDDPDVWFFSMMGTDVTEPPGAGLTDPDDDRGPVSVERRAQAAESSRTLMARYDPNSCRDQAAYEDDFLFGWNCDVSRYLDSVGDEQRVEFDQTAALISTPEGVLKAFHPKSIGFTGVKAKNSRMIYEQMANHA